MAEQIRALTEMSDEELQIELTRLRDRRASARDRKPSSGTKAVKGPKSKPDTETVGTDMAELMRQLMSDTTEAENDDAAIEDAEANISDHVKDEDYKDGEMDFTGDAN